MAEEQIINMLISQLSELRSEVAVMRSIVQRQSISIAVLEQTTLRRSNASKSVVQEVWQVAAAAIVGVLTTLAAISYGVFKVFIEQ